MKLAAVVNPIAGAGRAAREWPAAEAALAARFGAFPVLRTQAPEQASRLAEELSRKGAEIVVACGGDGTLSEVADGLMRAAGESGARPRLGALPVGTGSDFARTLGLSADILVNAARIAAEEWRAVDVGRLLFVDDDGRERARFFLNIASLGLSGPTDRAVNAAKRKGLVGGKLVFLFHSVRELLRYRFQNVRISVDDQPSFEACVALVAVANGRFFGGGMMIAPDAAIDDGAFDVVVLRASGKVALLRQINLLYRGAHVGLDIVTIVRGRKVTVMPLAPLSENVALVDIDGDSPGRIPATFEIRPRALMVAV